VLLMSPSDERNRFLALSNNGTLPLLDSLSRMPTQRVSPSALADWLMAQGRHFIGSDEAAQLLDVHPNRLSVSLQRAREAGKMVSITKGAWVPVPPEFRAAGAPPPLHFIDPLMRHLGHHYYVGLLSAARLHGAAHHAPMITQIVTPALLRDRSIGAHRLSFVRREATADRATADVGVSTGLVRVSTPEVTVLDLVDAPSLGGGLDNVATVAGEFVLEDLIDPDRLAAACGDFPVAVIQRMGYLVEAAAHAVGTHLDLDHIQHRVERAPLTLLDNRSGREGPVDERWRLVVNHGLDPDL
jgi:predicted transcriptional regulator of viral defense system